MTDLVIASIQFNVPWAAWQQIRLFAKFLTDDHELVMVDNSTDPAAAGAIRDVCMEHGARYLRVPGNRHEHPDALNYAAGLLRDEAPYFGVVDHDVFCRAPVTLIDKIEVAGFLGIGQTHRATGARYVKPSWCFFSRDWLAGRPLDFDGIRATDKADDGDCGSMLAPLFTDEDWARQLPMKHGYRHVREMDDHLQSWAVEAFGDDDEWVHLFNLSRWLAVSEPDDRERLVREMVEAY